MTNFGAGGNPESAHETSDVRSRKKSGGSATLISTHVINHTIIRNLPEECSPDEDEAQAEGAPVKEGGHHRLTQNDDQHNHFPS